MPKLGRRSEAHHIEYMYPNYSVTKNAPFGTTETPVQKPKIIGSKLVYTTEDGNFGTPSWAQTPKPSRYNTPKRSESRSSQTTPVKLTPLSGNPTNFNPHAIIQQTKAHYSSAHQDVHKSHIHHDSGFTSPPLNPHGVLPPIVTPSTSSHKKQNEPSNNGFGTDNGWKHQEYEPEYNLAKYLPPDGRSLPREPIQLSKEEELELRRLIREDLTGFNMSKLKDVYLELTGFDRHLTGCISFDNLLFSLLRAKVGISPENLRLVASLFISPSCNDESHGDTRSVNYEKILAFISAAQKDNGPLVADLRESPTVLTPVNYNSSPMPSSSPPTALSRKSETGTRTNYNSVVFADHSPRSKKFPYGARDNSKLLRMIEQAIVESGEELDYDKIYSTFRNFDREHRDMLSRDQIKMLAAKCRIPLQESLMDSIINKLDSSNGQYSWVQFLEFLERVQPANTGLYLPQSKRPIDYAKHLPDPSPDWPKKTTPRSPKQTHDVLTTSDNRDLYENEQRQVPQIQDESYNYTSNQEDLHMKQSEVKSHEQTNSRAGRNEHQRQEGLEPWFDRFMKLAKALYDNDVDANGYLSMEEVDRLIRLHNETLALGFDEDTVKRCVENCAVNESNVPIDNLLKLLSVHHS